MNVLDFTVLDLEKKPVKLDTYRGSVLLIVNTASKCGLATQMDGLENLQKKYKDQGFTVLAFPSNQFMGQEPLEGTEIETHCQTTYGTTFPIFDKTDVNGEKASDLYKYLVSETKNKKIKWNYSKFLINRHGDIVNRFAPVTTPDKIESYIVEELSKT